ncbi:SDH family Clp fold serine proteinase [Caldisericum exile]|uniref:SDH family Clp fold serine proteinase n=1 Tax=Caldisericum exile TaxID=693075 RepID=UPI003C71E3D8
MSGLDTASAILSWLFWIFIIISILSPAFQQKNLELQRLDLIRRFEQKRKSRVILLIHRQETMSLLGIPISRYISIEDSEAILRAIRLTPPEMPIDIILHTPGGLVLATEQIAQALVRHKGKVTVFIPHYAMSGGTMLALASDEIIMDENAVLGPVDPQIGNYPAASIIKVLEEKNKDRIDDETLILADVSKKAMVQVKEFVKKLLLANGRSEDDAERISTMLTEGRWTHDYPITFEEAKDIGLNVSSEMPREIYELMDLYPQNPSMRPSVQYVPLPYKAPERSVPQKPQK